MRRALWLLPTLSMMLGCAEKVGDSCVDFGTCPGDGGGGSAGASDGPAGTTGMAGAGGTSAGTGGSAGLAGASGGMKDSGPEVEAALPCNAAKHPADDVCVIDEKYGVFVSPLGSDLAAGTRIAPLKTIAKGLQVAKAASKRLYACDNGTGYAEQLTIDAALDGIAAFGSFRCDWSYSVSARAVVKPASSPVLTMKSLSMGATLDSFEFDAPDAAPGSSSIGAIIDTAANVKLRGVRIVAGKGGAGPPGASGSKGDDGYMVTATQRGIDAACGGGVPNSQAGGTWPDATTCGSLGGSGGQASKGLNGGLGIGGAPTTNVDPPGVDNGGPRAMPGNTGSPGLGGGIGTANAMPGTFNAMGYTPAPQGASGMDGTTGQGGGGGGASNATGTCIGASGGAGGMGGCGGKLGAGGSAGGASVALLSWMTTGLVLDSCELVSKDGGPGGKGGNGGPGGMGIDGAPGGGGLAPDAAASIGPGGKGGPGGNGGPGGSGAGGNGGPSYALVVKGTAPIQPGTTFTIGMGGALGAGGSIAGKAAPDGVAGATTQQFLVP